MIRIAVAMFDIFLGLAHPGFHIYVLCNGLEIYQFEWASKPWWNDARCIVENSWRKFDIDLCAYNIFSSAEKWCHEMETKFMKSDEVWHKFFGKAEKSQH